MKQKPTGDIEAAAVDHAVEAILAVRPDLSEMKPVLILVAREASRTTTDRLHAEGYISARTTGALPPLPPAQLNLAAPAMAMVVDVFGALLADLLTAKPKKT